MPAPPTARVVPCLRYRDARAAIDALCWVLGFEASLVVEGATADKVAHAQLRLGVPVASQVRRTSRHQIDMANRENSSAHPVGR